MKTIEEMNEDELKSHLLTTDYKGIDFKSLVLEELIKRKIEESKCQK